MHSFILFQKTREHSLVIRILFTTGKAEGRGGYLDGKHGRQTGPKPTWTAKFICVPMLHHSSHALSLCLLPLPFSDVTFQFSEDKKVLFFQFCLFCSHGIYLLPLSSRETRSAARWPPLYWLLPEAAFEMGRGREKERLREGREERESQTDTDRQREWFTSWILPL